MPRMNRWTEAKLMKELAFAEACKDDGAECRRWYEAVAAEAKRRGIPV